MGMVAVKEAVVKEVVVKEWRCKGWGQGARSRPREVWYCDKKECECITYLHNDYFRFIMRVEEFESSLRVES
jgi:hypothetical protein